MKTTLTMMVVVGKRRSSMRITTYDLDGTQRYSRAQRLPTHNGDGHLALRDDGTAVLVLPSSLGGTDYRRARTVAFDPRGRPLPGGPFPIRGASVEGAIAAVQCAGTLFWVTAFLDDDARMLHLDAVEIDDDGRAGPRRTIDALPLPAGATGRRRLFAGEPIRVACGDGHIGVVLRFPLSEDPGGGELVFRRLRVAP